ncbi:hypothetical protein E2320_022997 [Naja naja]|nr:hypothetical protein E2320_022997 [Naja naja]
MPFIHFPEFADLSGFFLNLAEVPGKADKPLQDQLDGALRKTKRHFGAGIICRMGLAVATYLLVPSKGHLRQEVRRPRRRRRRRLCAAFMVLEQQECQAGLDGWTFKKVERSLVGTRGNGEIENSSSTQKNVSLLHVSEDRKCVCFPSLSPIV